MGVYKAAIQTRRYDSKYPRQRYQGGPNKGILHTTETTGLPGYQYGSQAPHFTVVPDIRRRTVVVYQHFDTNRPSRALVDKDGGPETNNDGAIQIELVGTCSKAYAKKYGAIYWPDAPKWAMDELKKLMRWIEADRGIPRKGTKRPWLPYPSSYGNSPARMTATEWDNFAGWCGHMHVFENSHGDPGDLDMGYLLERTGLKVVTRIGVTLTALAAAFGISTAQLEAANPGIAPSIRPSSTVTLPYGVNPTPDTAKGITVPAPTAPAPKPVTTSTTRTLVKGMSGADVKALQVKLGIPADGDFGPKTDRAVRDFQYVKGLTVDGRVGPATRAKLGKGWSKPVLRRGSTGRYVVIVQRRLGVATDGKFGPKTEAAVKRFEKAAGLLANGVWGDSTWRRMYR